jgi:hypothetical protein
LKTVAKPGISGANGPAPPKTTDLIGIAGVYDAGGEPVGEAKPLLHLAQRQNAAIRRKQTAIKFDHDRLPARR